MSAKREIYFHEDDYCQQQLLPREAAAYAGAEIQKIGEFADSHRVPGGLGWTDIYVRKEAPVELRTLRIKRQEFAALVSSFLTSFDVVYTGYSSHREVCRKTGAWGNSQQCALLADWDEDGIIANVWAEFFAEDEESILAASKAVAALGRLHPLVYVDWAWGYTCDASEERAFASMLRAKLDSIAENVRSLRKGEQDHRSERERSTSVTDADAPDCLSRSVPAFPGEETVGRVETPRERTYTLQEVVEGVLVIGFVDRGSEGISPDATHDQDIAEFKSRMNALGEGGQPVFAVVDFSNYHMTWDNGRMLIGILLRAHGRLKAQGGGLLVCNHPAQLNPDFQSAFHFDEVIDFYSSRGDALVAARSPPRMV
jgi:hypothetical protein